MKRVILVFGLIAGAVLSLMMVLTIPFWDRIGFENSAVLGYSTMVAAFLTIHFGVRSYRDNTLGGAIGFGRALAVGLSITAIASVCYASTWMVVQQRMAPDFMEKYSAHELEKARAEGATAAELEKQSSEMAKYQEWYKNPFMRFGMTFLEPLPVGVILSLVSAGVLSRRRRGSAVAAAAAG